MLSAVIITKDEEEHIRGCILSIVDVAEEIVVVDANSTDHTRHEAVAASSKVKFVTKDWSGYGNARNYGAELAKQDWILSIDADERCSPQLQAVISREDLRLGCIYQFKRINIYRGKRMRYGFFSPEVKARIYHKGTFRWDEADVHESLQSTSSSQGTKMLEGELLHYTYENPDSHRQKMRLYAHLCAKQWIDQGRSPSALERALSPLYHFMRHHFLRGGILDAKYGYETSISAYMYHAEKYRQYKKLSDNQL